jgi:chromosome segregation ATPase
MLTEVDFHQIQDYFLKQLPQWLRQSPEIVTTLEGIMAQQFPRRDDFARLLEEMKSLRQEVSWRLELQSQELHDHRQEVEQRLALHRQELHDFRQEVEQRLASHSQELHDFRQEVEQRLALHSQELHDFRKEVEQRLASHSQELHDFRKEVEQRLALHSQEILDLRKEMEQRHDSLRQEIELLRQEMERRFEQVDKRFESVDQQFVEVRSDILQIKRKIIKLQAGQENILKRLDGQENWLRLTIGSLHSDKGETLEDMFAAGLRYGLKDDEITADTIRLREPLVDEEGLVFEKGYETEVDLVAQNGRLTVFEVKATAKAGEVDFFAWKVKLVRAQNPTLQVRGVFICLGAPSVVKRRCRENGLELLS